MKLLLCNMGPRVTIYLKFVQGLLGTARAGVLCQCEVFSLPRNGQEKQDVSEPTSASLSKCLLISQVQHP